MELELICIPKKINPNKYLIKIYSGEQSLLLGMLTAIASNKIDFGIATFPLPKKHWILEEFEVKEEIRGQGIGSVLLKFSLEYLKKKSNLPLLVVPPLNEWTKRLEKWYERHGFTNSRKGFLVNKNNPDLIQ